MAPTSGDAVDRSYDAAVGLNLQSLRKSAGTSQEELAAEMRSRGLPFSQTTIVRIEQGKRPLRLQEAQMLADALNTPLVALTVPSDLLDSRTLAVQLIREIQEAGASILRGAVGVLRAQERLEDLVLEVAADRSPFHDTAGQRHPLIDADLLSEMRAYLESSPESIVEQVRQGLRDVPEVSHGDELRLS